MSFYDKILYLLNKKSKTQNQMIRDLNLGRNAMVHWRNNNNIPCGDTLLKLSHYFQVPIDFLLDNTESYLSAQFISEELDDHTLSQMIDLLSEEYKRRNLTE
ncbi:MAG: helix-turn-helix transcriptional regulator [Oscillospiraceae bacterium]|nr:helix-turn-helix transcriptional regulator [Oscillospiraceae bacterium]